MITDEFGTKRATQIFGSNVQTKEDTYTQYPTEKVAIVRALKGEKSCVDDMEIHRHDEVIHLRIEGAPIRDEEGKIIYAAATFTDVSEIQKTMRKLYELNALIMKKSFADNNAKQ